MKFKIESKFIQIGKLEIFWSTKWAFGKLNATCGCHIYELGFFGFTWLSGECR